MSGLLVEVPVAVGDLIDRITILEIKLEKIADDAKRGHVRREYALLTARRDTALDPCPHLEALTRALAAINRTLWDVENALRAMERDSDFGPDFIAQARNVYRTNDERARIKRRIDALTGSALSEHKSYV